MAKIYVATLHTGNTLTIHGQTFFKGRPTVVKEPVLVDYLKSHPNFRIDERIVSSKESEAEAQTQAVKQVRHDLKEEGEYVAPKIFEKDIEADAPSDPAPADSNDAGVPVVKPAAATTRKGAVSAPRPVIKG